MEWTSVLRGLLSPRYLRRRLTGSLLYFGEGSQKEKPRDTGIPQEPTSGLLLLWARMAMDKVMAKIRPDLVAAK